LAEARDRVSELNSQIADLQLAICALRHEREAIEDQLDVYKYPVLTLPNETVSEIFMHFLPVYPDRPAQVELFSPATLGQICGKWREIAVATPSLW
ncbi:hypothetical protein DFH09DRAFT_857437, partial [Mycena vulgaris]